MTPPRSGLSETACVTLSRTLWEERLRPFGIEKVAQERTERALMRCCWRYPEHEVRRWLSKCLRRARAKGVTNPQGMAISLILEEDVQSALVPGPDRYRIDQAEHQERLEEWKRRKTRLEGYEPEMSLYELFELQKRDPAAAKAMGDRIKEECNGKGG